MSHRAWRIANSIWSICSVCIRVSRPAFWCACTPGMTRICESSEENGTRVGFFFVCVEVTPTQKSSEQPAALLIRREVTNSPRRFPTLPYLLSVSDKLPYWRGMFSRLTAGGGREESGKDRRKKKDPSQMYYLFKPTWSTQTASVCCQVQQVDKNSGRTLDKLLIWKQDSHRPVEEFCGILSWGLPKRP